MGLSKDGRIGFAIATGVGIALVLIKSEEAPWRIGLLSFFGICAIYVAKELDWVNLRNVELSILHPASQSESLSPIRLAVAILAAVSVTVMFGIITWPPHERAASVVLVSTSAPTPSGEPTAPEKPALQPVPIAKPQPVPPPKQPSAHRQNRGQSRSRLAQRIQSSQFPIRQRFTRPIHAT